MIDKAINLTAAALGLLLMANGLCMVAAPGIWYASVPGVSDSGPLNQHLVVDIGMFYLVIGSAFVTGAIWSRSRLALWLFAAVWLGAHALFHLEEAMRDSNPVLLVTRDFVGVTLPALLGVPLVLLAIRQTRR